MFLGAPSLKKFPLFHVARPARRGRDCDFQARMKFSSENEIFTREACKFQAFKREQRLVLIRGEQRAPENATHPKTQVINRSQNLRVRVCVTFWSALCSALRGRQNTQLKTQILGTVDCPRFQACCVFGCVLAPMGDCFLYTTSAARCCPF